MSLATCISCLARHWSEGYSNLLFQVVLASQALIAEGSMNSSAATVAKGASSTSPIVTELEGRCYAPFSYHPFSRTLSLFTRRLTPAKVGKGDGTGAVPLHPQAVILTLCPPIVYRLPRNFAPSTRRITAHSIHFFPVPPPLLLKDHGRARVKRPA